MAPRKLTEQEKREKATLKKRLQRSDPIKRRYEQTKDTAARRQSRASSAVRRLEQKRDTTARRLSRADTAKRKAEQSRNTEAHRVTRSETDKRKAEQSRDTEAHRITRSDTVKRKAEQSRNTEAHRVTRSDTAKRKTEQSRDTEAHRVTRSDTAKRKAEQSRDTKAHRVTRSDTVKRKAEQSRNTDAHRVTRSDTAKRKTEQSRDTEAHRVTRSDTAKRKAEQSRNTESHRARRSVPINKKAEQFVNTLKKRAKRTNPEFQARERQLDAIRKAKNRLAIESDFNTQSNKFKKKIQDGPTHVCSCCGRLWYRTSITKVTKDRILNQGVSEDTVEKVLFVNASQHGLCNTCWKHVKSGKLPKLALANGFGLPPQPNELKDMTPLEERLVALRIPFAQIRAKGLEKQSALFGNIVNVECDLTECAKVLPRQFNELSVVQVMFKRRLSYKHPVWNERIRPYKVYKAAQYLIKTPGYLKHDAVLSDHWKRHQDVDSMDFIVEQEENLTEEDPNEQDGLEEFHNPSPENRVNLGAEETLIYDNSQLKCISIAPGENKIPVPLNRDLRAEELSFPCTWCGQERVFNENLKITLTDVKKSDIMQYDRRAATPQQVLYGFRKSNNEQIKQQIQVCLRRRKMGEQGNITAGNIKTPGFVDNLVQVDDGYMVFKNVRGSTAYWKAQTKRVVAMVRQQGKCSFFITLSAAETKWPELLVMLSKILKGQTITEEQALEMTFEEKAELIRSDPVTCMRHFEFKYRNFLNEILRNKAGAFNPEVLADYFSRLEFQVRGSPHMHGLFWIKDAPEYMEGNGESEAAVIRFIDEFITCKRDEEGDMENLIGYQIHKHSQTCYKGKSSKCRFHYPKPPLPTTRILKPFQKDADKAECKKFQSLYHKIEEKMNDLGRTFKENMSFEDFLEMFECNEDDYINAIRSSINRDTVFLKRETSGMFVNAYNKKMLTTWRANMDIQYVLDTYACAKYCVGYIMKAESGVSKLLQAAEKDIKRGNYTLQEKLYKLGSALINGGETSAQEAVAYQLGMPMTRSSRTDVFINTSPREERVVILKPNEKLATLEDDDEDIFEKGLLDHYSSRPTQLENTCLAEFASMYNFSTSKTKKRHPVMDEEEEMGVVEETAGLDLRNPVYKLVDGSGYVTRRNVRKIIRFRNYSRAQDEYNYCRERLMLFVPWRDEEVNAIQSQETVIAQAKQLQSLICKNSVPFFAKESITDTTLQDAMNDIEENEGEEEQRRINVLDVEELEDYTLQFLSDKRISKTADQFRPPERVSDEDYYALMQSLNQNQRRFVMAVLHNFKTKKPPFHIFLTGGAGVGKSHVIKAVIQSLKRHDELFPTETPEDVSILVAAPTGKAAFNVQGMTVHSTFQLPPTQSKTPLLDLQAGSLNTLRLKFRRVKLIIIDEVSMLSSRDLFNIDQRLRQIFETSQDFGGRSILVVGHLRQLPPVMATYVFAPPSIQKGSLVGNYLWRKFRFFELDEIQRQKGDHKFCKALNNMAEGIMDEEDEQLIKSREVCDRVQPPSSAVRLFYSNKDCQEYNLRYHDTLGTEGTWSYAFDRIEGQGTNFRKSQLIYAAKEFDASKSDGIPYQVHLQIGAIYFISTNVDVKDGLFNGSTGRLMRIDYSSRNDGMRIPTAVWILFEDESIGALKRTTTLNYQISKGIPPTWTLIERETRNLSKLSSNALQVMRTQLPLVAANGMTIHKSQGSTLQNVVVHIGQRGLKRELKYVACSRASSLNGLFVDGKFTKPTQPSENDPVTKALSDLRNRPMEFPLRYLQDFTHKKERLYFHNIQSFPKYKADLTADHSTVKSNAATQMVFVEPHIKSNDEVNLENFSCVTRVNSSSNGQYTKSDGALVFRPERLSPGKIKHVVYRENGVHFTSLSIELEDVIIVAMYRHPRYSVPKFYSELEEILQGIVTKAIFLGDVNLDMRKEGRSLSQLFEKYEFTTNLSLDEPTTNNGTTIDICFSNFVVDAWLMETYYSYHKSICVVW